MYKSKLQELCHQRLWNLPEYSTSKDGLDHAPSFTATVTVNGLTFRNPEPSKSVKESQNEAAKVAFDYFTGSPRSPGAGDPSVAVCVEFSSENSNVNNAGQSGLPNTHQMSGVIDAKDDAGRTDMRHMGKNQLQMYAEKTNLHLPTYSYEREGPPHDSLFKCKVTIDGKTFESPTYFKTLKDAEHAAARVALSALASDEVHTNDNGLYKNLLQEFTQKEGYRLPLYETSILGGHIPHFISTVEVEGERFTGEQEMNKKQAEMSAAKAAYTDLTNRKRSRSTSVQLPYQQQAFSSPNKSQPYVCPPIEPTVKSTAAPLPISPILTSEQIETLEQSLSKLKGTVPSPTAEVPSVRKEVPPLSNMAYAQLTGPFPSGVGVSSSNSLPEYGKLDTESSTETPDKVEYSSSNVVRVYPRATNQTFPEENVAFRDENWVAVTVKKAGAYLSS